MCGCVLKLKRALEICADLQVELWGHVPVDVPDISGGWQSTEGRVAPLEPPSRAQSGLKFSLRRIEKPGR